MKKLQNFYHINFREDDRLHQCRRSNQACRRITLADTTNSAKRLKLERNCKQMSTCDTFSSPKNKSIRFLLRSTNSLSLLLCLCLCLCLSESVTDNDAGLLPWTPREPNDGIYRGEGREPWNGRWVPCLRVRLLDRRSRIWFTITNGREGCSYVSVILSLFYFYFILGGGNSYTLSRNWFFLFRKFNIIILLIY